MLASSSSSVNNSRLRRLVLFKSSSVISQSSPTHRLTGLDQPVIVEEQRFGRRFQVISWTRSILRFFGIAARFWDSRSQDPAQGSQFHCESAKAQIYGATQCGGQTKNGRIGRSYDLDHDFDKHWSTRHTQILLGQVQVNPWNSSFGLFDSY